MAAPPGDSAPHDAAPLDASEAGADSAAAGGDVGAPQEPETVASASTAGADGTDGADGDAAGDSEAAPTAEPTSDGASDGPAQGTTTKVAAGDAVSLPPPLFKDAKKSCGNAPGVGDKAKPFTLKTPGGKDISLTRYRRRVVLLNFWGTWCKPCLKELPEFDRLYRRYRKYGLTLIAVATDEEPEKVQEFAKQRKLAAKLVIGGQDLADAYGSPKFPFSFVIDTKGVIQAAYRGYEAGCLGTLERDIRAQLEKIHK